MTETEPPTEDAWGILSTWIDAHDEPHEVPPATIELIRGIIGEPPEDLEDRAPIVTRPGRDLGLDPGEGGLQVELEDGTTRTVGATLADDFPLGYHRVTTRAGVRRRLIVSPGTCWLPPEQRWGWAVQLYAARSRAGWGIGDLRDLRTIREWTEGLGGGFLLVNPLHAVGPSLPQEASPYLPATRRFRNPVYLRVEDVPGFKASRIEAYADQLAAARKEPLLDRDAVWTLKDRVLREVFERTTPLDEPAVSNWRGEQGAGLEAFARWSVIAVEHGPDWHAWPAQLQDPDGPAVTAYAHHREADVGFHVWLQWLLDEQLRAATGEMTVIQDLPIGVSGGGSDAWAAQDVLAHGVTVGAPPDMLNTVGQDWGSPPLVPWRLRQADYEPFVESLRGTIAGAGGLRIDHVMGLFRLWWVPADDLPTEGAYVRYPSEDLLDIVCLESHRAQAVVVGEDLGTVEEGVPQALASRNILSYRLLWFEDDEPDTWPELALAAVTTHDLPTVAGLWTGSDVDDQLESSDMSEEDVRSGREELLARLTAGGVEEGEPVAKAVQAAYTRLALAPSLLLSATLEDAVQEERRPNVPGTTERENWQIPLALTLEDLLDSPDAAGLAALLGDRVRDRADRVNEQAAPGS